MTVLNENSVVVYNSAELKTVLEGNNGYTTVYFGSDITLTNGISISSSKVNVIIDGTYNNVTYKFEDKKSASTSDTISVSSAMTKNVVVRNMNITGYNYYGIIYVAENNIYKDVVVEYNNINYVGPQISFHPMGLTRFIDCVITIQDNYASGNEVAECNKIEIGGQTVIVHKSSSNSSFWFRNSDPSLTILPNAMVDFTSEKRELFYGVSNLTFNILTNASFYVKTNSGMGYGVYGTGTTNISENALFSLKQTARNGSYPSWYSYGKITLNTNSILEIISNYPNISSSNYNIYFSGSDAGFILNNPDRVILYNSVSNVIYTNSDIAFEFNFNRLNLFKTAVLIDDKVSVSNLPDYAWYKEKGLSLIKGTFSNSSTKVTSHNYTDEELNNLPNLDDFIFTSKKVLSIGDFQIHMNALTDTDTQINGITEPLASILIEYDDVVGVVVAEADGSFSYSYDQALPVGTNITLTAKLNDDLIYHTKKVQIVYTGEIILDEATKIVNFNLSPIKTNPILCPRLNELYVEVIDSRAVSSNWELYASINHDLTSNTGEVLKDSLVFVDENENLTVLSSTPTLVYTGQNNDGSTKLTKVIWDDDKGILLKISDAIKEGMEYSAIITWSLKE